MTIPHLPSREADATPQPESAGEHAQRAGGSSYSLDARFEGGRQNLPAPKMVSLRVDLLSDQEDEYFLIWLVFQGNSVQRNVVRSMRVFQLVLDTSIVFQLAPETIVLVLFSMTPVTLDKSKTLAGPPLVPHNSRIMVFQVPAPPEQGHSGPGFVGNSPSRGTAQNLDPRGPPPYAKATYSKLLGTFKLPKFDGAAKNWKGRDRSFHRFLGLHELDHVLREDFLSSPPLSQEDFTANKIVYFLVEDAVAPGTLAAKYVRQAALWNGNAAYTFLHNGFVFSGPQTATVLLAQLSNLRFLRDETGSAFCLRLVEIIEDLEMIPGKAAIFMTDTQKLGYLLTAIRHEKDLQGVYVQLQSDQLRGTVTFEQACQELHHRCEAIRADEMLDFNVGNPQKDLLYTGLVSTAGKKNGKTGQSDLAHCLAKDCASMIVSYLPLCKSCYLQCTAGKTPSVDLRDGMGKAKYNVQTLRIDFPSTVPVSRLPEKNKSGKGKSKQKVGVCRIGFENPSTVSSRLGLASSSIVRQISGTDNVVFYLDSGAGQCLCSCSSAFLQMSPCHIELTGLSGSLQVYGCGTALFVATSSSNEQVVLRIHNCLFSYGDFNLISVSHLSQVTGNLAKFTASDSSMVLGQCSGSKRTVTFDLKLDDGLYGLVVEPLQADDARYNQLPKFDVTPRGDFLMGKALSEERWHPRVIAVASQKPRFLVAPSADYDDHLKLFCSDFLAPPSLPDSKRQYDVDSHVDMSELSIRFLGCGTDRLKHTVGISNGLSKPASKTSKRVPTLNFPQGRWKKGKTPRVSKGKVAHLHKAGIGECVFTDTFESKDSKYAYGQAYVDYVSRYGDVFPTRSRTAVEQSLADFCCRNWIPLMLIRDNIGENKGGQIMDECRQRDIKSAYICPHHPEQNFAEGYLGRVTAMASFGMVYSGAPLFMWIFAIRCAVFINNITACYYSKVQQWTTPYELIHGEPFPDTSIVVPFGCGALILNDTDDRSKFQSRCTMMIFLHYADEHPLFTYAFYSPRTKRVLYRQDCIFLTSVFQSVLLGLHLA